MDNMAFHALVAALAAEPQVDAILLAGSRAAGGADQHSDYDLYVYLNAPLPLARRKALITPHCSVMEFDNRYWEPEDDGILIDGCEIEIIYRDLAWLEESLTHTLCHYQAGTGYSTCFWFNLLHSQILHDPKGLAAALQARFTLPYPEPLRQAILDKNVPLLRQAMPAYRHQIAKALSRGDSLSVLHRLAEYQAAYFDILFALNSQPHPGEKRLLAQARARCPRLPAHFEQDWAALLAARPELAADLLERLDALTDRLETLIEEQGLGVNLGERFERAPTVTHA